MTTEIRVSWAAGGESHWRDCADILARHGFKGDVHPGTAVRADGSLEPSALVRVYGADRRSLLRTLWPALKEKLGLTCAHVSTADGFSGCVHDLWVESRCPHCAPSSQPSASSVLSSSLSPTECSTTQSVDRSRLERLSSCCWPLCF